MQFRHITAKIHPKNLKFADYRAGRSPHPPEIIGSLEALGNFSINITHFLYILVKIVILKQ